MQKPMGYWIYEVCIGEEVRQFHSYVNGVDRHQTTSLGKFDATSQDFNSIDGSIQRYSDGDRCEPSRKRRRSSVSFACGPHNRIIEVSEPEPCFYAMAVELQSACGSPPPPSEVEFSINQRESSAVSASTDKSEA